MLENVVSLVNKLYSHSNNVVITKFVCTFIYLPKTKRRNHENDKIPCVLQIFTFFLNAPDLVKKFTSLHTSFHCGYFFLSFVQWDFGYCGHYWPIVPAPDDR
jgi:hypothetical protein